MERSSRPQTLSVPVPLPRGSSWARRMFGPDWKVALPFVLPLVVLLAALIAIPFFDAIRLSFTTRTITNATNYVGLQNYKDLLQDKFFKDAVKNTIVFTTYSEVFKVTVGLIAALLLHNLRRGRSVLTGLVLLPWIVPTVVTALAWRSIYDPIFGGLNKALIATHLGTVLQHLHLVDRIPASWLGEADLAMPSVILVNVWKGIPFFTLNFLAGLKSIDNDLYEAASVDGANTWQKFINVTLPGLRYVILVTTLLSTIWTFNTFDVIYLLTGGGPGGSTRPFVVFAYEKAILGLQFGPGAAVAIMMLPILAIFIFFLARYMRRADQQVQETALDRFFSEYGKLVLYIGLAVFAIFLYWLNGGMFIRAIAILAVIVALGLGFGYLTAWLADLGVEQRRQQRTLAAAGPTAPLLPWLNGPTMTMIGGGIVVIAAILATVKLGRSLLFLTVEIWAIGLFLLVTGAIDARSARAIRREPNQSEKATGSVLSHVPAWLAMVVLLFLVLAPFYWIIITAFKSELQTTSQQGNVFWPQPWTMDQFHKLLGGRPFGTWFRNSVIVAISSTVFSVIFAALAGYALARLRFRGAQTLAGIVLLTYLIPSALLFIPLYQILSLHVDLDIGVIHLHIPGLINSLGALIVTYPTFALPYASWLLMGYFRSIPEELENAAMIDGATRFQAFRRITLPLAKPALLAVALFTFTNAFNEFLFAFVFITKETLKTLPVGLQGMIFGDVYPYGQLMAGAILMAVPVVLVYSYGQKFLVEGLTAGSVKG